MSGCKNSHLVIKEMSNQQKGCCCTKKVHQAKFFFLLLKNHSLFRLSVVYGLHDLRDVHHDDHLLLFEDDVHLCCGDHCVDHLVHDVHDALGVHGVHDGHDVHGDHYAVSSCCLPPPVSFRNAQSHQRVKWCA